MPRVFVYEHVTATGLGRDHASPEHSLFLEGLAMRSAVSADFAAVPGVEVVQFPDGITPDDHADAFRRLAASAGRTFIIAPETGGELLRLAQLARLADARLLGPSLTGIRFTADKRTLAGLWEEEGVPTPHTFDSGEPLRFPVVCKPRDGCGSDQTYLIHSADELAVLPPDPNRLVQEFVPGQPASVAFLVGPKQTIPLLPTFQNISDDGRFRYLGGGAPIAPELAARAVALGLRAVEAVAGLSGFVGVDLVLGERDVAIEINPRLTTSYVGLRALADTNLVGALLDVCEGRPVKLKWKFGSVRWLADGWVS